MAHRTPSFSKYTKLYLLVFVLVVGVLLPTALLRAEGERLENRSLTLSDSRAGATGYYKFSFKPTQLSAIQTVVLQVCANDPFPLSPCTPPVGFDASNAVLQNQSGDEGFTIASQSTANEIVLTRPPLSSYGQQNTYEFSNIVNPSSEGSYYVRILTFMDSDTNGEPNNYGGIAFAINRSIAVSATVPPYLLFCVGVTINGFNCKNVVGNYLNFGEFDSRRATQGSTQLLAATNAKDGYNIRVAGISLTSGNNVIPNLTSPDVSRPGVSQFGMNLLANTSPQGGIDPQGIGTGVAVNGYNQSNFFKFNPTDIIAVANQPDESRKYTATYIVNVAKDQAPGVYVSTVTYIAMGSF
jgi:hypothetical protein